MCRSGVNYYSPYFLQAFSSFIRHAVIFLHSPFPFEIGDTYERFRD